MKRSELRQIIKEEIIREGLLDRVFDHLRNSATDASKKRAVAKVNNNVAKGLDKLATAEDELKKMLRGELSDAEMDELIKKLS